MKKIVSFFIDIRTKKRPVFGYQNLFVVKKNGYNHSIDNQKYIIEKYLSHKFDYLGTSWITISRYNYQLNNYIDIVNHNLNQSHKNYTLKLLSEIDNSYKLIDWQLDVKSGYKWSSKKHWSESLKTILKIKGVEIKNPWEVGRLYHLGQIALIALENKRYRTKLLNEFRNQVLDFYAFNPIYMGVQWACTMDVSIRAVNLIMSYSTFDQIDNEDILNDKFKKHFTNFIFLHGKYIFKHLEKQPDFTNNHYFSNLCGLIFISCFIKNETTEKWLVFGINEFLLEFERQFNSDGSNVEASTAYHCLVSEMVLFTTSLLLGLKSNIVNKINSNKFIKLHDNQIYFTKCFENRISNIFNFCKASIDPNGNIIQIGDNDSGRFLNFNPVWEYDNSTKEFHENCLNKESILAGFCSLFNQESHSYNNCPEYHIIKSLSKGRNLRFIPDDFQINMDIRNNYDLPKLNFLNTKKYNYESIDKLTQKIKTYYFDDFGLILWKNKDVWMSLYFGQVGQCGNGGHSHNDKFSINLFIKNSPVAVDPGTYNYTAFPEERNRFRSYLSHHQAINISSYTPEFSGHHLFSFSEEFQSYLLFLNNHRAKVLIKKGEKIFLREIYICNDHVYISTKSNFSFKVGEGLNEHSNSYGIKN